MKKTIAPATRPLRASLVVPGDKSISHRALIFGSLFDTSAIFVTNLATGADVRSTRTCVERAGAMVAERPGGLLVRGGRRVRESAFDCGNSGTTMRLLTGDFAANEGLVATLTGDASLSRRPMERVAAPLRRMGATIDTTDGHAPIRVRGAKLRGCEHRLEIASAQVKSAILIAGLFALGETRVIEPARSRDHTERMLRALGIAIATSDDGLSVAVSGDVDPPRGTFEVRVPGDLSSAAFPIVAALIVPGSEITIERVGLNPTRTGFLEILDAMGADVTAEVEGASGGEPYGSIAARAGRELRAVEVSGELTVRAIDELPALFALAAFARGRSVFEDARELRKKESDRIAAMARGLRALGVECEELEDGLAVVGDPDRTLRAASVASEDDHRIAMSLALAALRASSEVEIDGAESVAISYPTFFDDLERART